MSVVLDATLDCLLSMYYLRIVQQEVKGRKATLDNRNCITSARLVLC